MKIHRGFIYAAYIAIAIALLDLLFGQSETPVPIFGSFLTQQIDAVLIIGGLFFLLI